MKKIQIVLNYYLDKYKTSANTVTDITFDNLPFLYSKEPIYDMKGQKISKSYYDRSKNKEAIRIMYHKLFETKEGIENVFVGIQKEILYIDWVGEVGYTKKLQPYYFSLIPVFDVATGETITGYSSMKQMQILEKERYNADYFLQGHNPQLYSLIYNAYTADYESYLKTGDKTALVNALTNETDTTLLGYFNKDVIGMDGVTVKDLIIMNLQ